VTAPRPVCGARPVAGAARCDQDPADCKARGWHWAPLAIGGRLRFREDSRTVFERREGRRRQETR
jgi:hypothetical protein